MDFDGKAALVTGASRNIGQAVATELAALGADVGVSAKDNREGCLETAARIEEAGGAVVNLLGAMVYLGRSGHVHSYGSKMGIEGLVRQLATEFGPDGIRVNGLSPGLIDTGRELTDEWERTRKRVIEATPLGRTGTVEEMADTCCFLASDRASFVTGQVLHANGGTYPIPNVVPPE